MNRRSISASRPGLIFAVAIVVGAAIALAQLIQHWAAITLFIQQTQSSLHRDLAAVIQAVKAEDDFAFWSLVLVSFGYGVFHAAGPGHGKMVIATYLASRPESLARGLTISVLSSLMQGLTAVVAMGIGVWLLGGGVRDTNKMSMHLETASFALVGCVGLYLIAGSLRRMWRRMWRRGRGGHGDHTHGAGCGHDTCAHPTTGQGGLWQSAIVIFSIGIRPCSGAILVLVLAFALDLVWGGVVAVMMMSVGTAITVSTLAVIAVNARSFAQSLSQGIDRSYLLWIGDGVAICGGVAILFLGISLAMGSISVQSHPLL